MSDGVVGLQLKTNYRNAVEHVSRKHCDCHNVSCRVAWTVARSTVNGWQVPECTRGRGQLYASSCHDPVPAIPGTHWAVRSDMSRMRVTIHRVKWRHNNLWSRYDLHVVRHDAVLCEVNWWTVKMCHVITARLMSQYCFARWRLSSSVTLPLDSVCF